MRVLVVGATGYIGKFVTRELVKRGYQTIALARERSGIKGKLGPEDTRRVRSQSRETLSGRTEACRVHAWPNCWIACLDHNTACNDTGAQPTASCACARP